MTAATRYHTTYYERGEEYPLRYREYPAYYAACLR